jgi:hypothetical protein
MAIQIMLHEWTAEGFCAICGEERCKLTELAECEEDNETPTSTEDSD